MFQGVTLVSVPVLSPSWELLLILTAAGHAHDLDAEALESLSRAMQSGGGAAVGERAIAASWMTYGRSGHPKLQFKE